MNLFQPNEIVALVSAKLQKRKTIAVVDIDIRNDSRRARSLNMISQKRYLAERLIFDPLRALQLGWVARNCSLVMFKGKALVEDFGRGRPSVKNFFDTAHSPEHIIPVDRLDQKLARVRSAEGPVRLVYFGRLVQRKGVDLCLRSVVQAREKLGAKVTFTIIGDGPDKPALEALAKELKAEAYVSFVPPVPFGPALFDALYDCDVLLARPADRRHAAFGLRRDGLRHGDLRLRHRVLRDPGPVRSDGGHQPVDVGRWHGPGHREPGRRPRASGARPARRSPARGRQHADHLAGKARGLDARVLRHRLMTTALGTPRPGTLSASELSAAVDLMRALAALLMITNHVGVLLLAPELSEAGLIGFTVFVGSAAPVLFFFVTGFGLGLRRPDAPPPRWAGLDKALPLWIADLFLVWQGGRLWGLDFFAFSAIAMVVVGWVASRRRAVPIALPADRRPVRAALRHRAAGRAAARAGGLEHGLFRRSMASPIPCRRG